MDKKPANTPNLLKPWSIVPDEELARLRKLEVIATAHIMHLLQDPQVMGINRLGVDFTAAELADLIRIK